MKNIFIFVHGIIPEETGFSYKEIYDSFWNKIIKYNSKIKDLIDEKIYVEWGHPLTSNAEESIRPDQKLTFVQNWLNEKTSFSNIKHTPGLEDILNLDWGILGIRNFLINIREKCILKGLGDAIYFCSPDGEKNLRRTVFKQILSPLQKYIDEKDIRLHIFAHSLGVSIVNDFLYGLFNEEHISSYLNQAENGDGIQYNKLKEKVNKGELILGSLFSAASQLPLLLLKSQQVIDKFYNNEKLDPKLIGINKNSDIIKWKIFYDVDDLLSFPTRRIFEETKAIVDIQVDNCDTPISHVKYWNNNVIVSHICETLINNGEVG